MPKVYAPPAIVLWHEPQDQMPTLTRLTVSLPQNTHVYLECWLISIFFTTLRSEEPYRTPYLPVIPAFLVRCAHNGRWNARGGRSQDHEYATLTRVSGLVW